MSQWPRTGCSVIATQGDKVLLIKRGKEPFKGYWSLPGGSQEIGETLESCARRELLEETGLTCDELSFVQVTDRIGHDEHGKVSHHFVLATYLAKKLHGHAIAGDDANDLGWYPVSDLDDLRLTPGVAALIKDTLKF